MPRGFWLFSICLIAVLNGTNPALAQWRVQATDGAALALLADRCWAGAASAEVTPPSAADPSG
jgi:hypothetical protein